MWRNANIPPDGPSSRCQRTLTVEGDTSPSIGHEGPPFQPKQWTAPIRPPSGKFIQRVRNCEASTRKPSPVGRVKCSVWENCFPPLDTGSKKGAKISIVVPFTKKHVLLIPSHILEAHCAPHHAHIVIGYLVKGFECSTSGVAHQK